MSALKNLIRIAFCMALILSSRPMHAQILGMGINFEKLNLPEPFLQNLENCTAYKFSQASTADEIKVKTTYSIAPDTDNRCHLHIDGETNVSVHISQDCRLTPEQAKTYAQALRDYQAKRYSPRWDGHRIEKDPDYLRAFAIMSDRQTCRFLRQKIDHTSEIRKNLTACKPTVQEEATASLKVERKIIKAENDKCLYTFQITQLNKDDAAGINSNISFTCKLDPERRDHYLKILENLVIPEEEGFDFSSVQRISVAEELNFILDNCDLDSAH